jgi:hypothetical protein
MGKTKRGAQGERKVWAQAGASEKTNGDKGVDLVLVSRRVFSHTVSVGYNQTNQTQSGGLYKVRVRSWARILLRPKRDGPIGNRPFLGSTRGNLATGCCLGPSIVWERFESPGTTPPHPTPVSPPGVPTSAPLLIPTRFAQFPAPFKD